jgi:hypothetical protein
VSVVTLLELRLYIARLIAIATYEIATQAFDWGGRGGLYLGPKLGPKNNVMRSVEHHRNLLEMPEKSNLLDMGQYQPKQCFPPSKTGVWQSVAADCLPGSSSN